MILIGIGSNLPGAWGSPKQALRRSLAAFEALDVKLVKISGLYTTQPYGRAGQPVYANAVAQVQCSAPPDALLWRLHAIEAQAGRARGRRWGARVLDLDLLDWHGAVRGPRNESGNSQSPGYRALSLPHPGLSRRPFVIIPLAEICPDWHHPVSGYTAKFLARRALQTPDGQVLRVEPF